MHYTTIVLTLIEERPSLHEQLRRSRQLLATVHRFAAALKTCQESWKVTLASTQRNSDPIQLASQSLERATQELIESLPTPSAATGETETLSLDAAMAFLRRHMPSA